MKKIAGFIFKYSLLIWAIITPSISIAKYYYFQYLWEHYHLLSYATQNTPDDRILGNWNIAIFILEYGFLFLGALSLNTIKK